MRKEQISWYLKAQEIKLSDSKSLKIAVCTYHRKHDSRVTEKILREYGFNYSFSGGYSCSYITGLLRHFSEGGLSEPKNREE